MAIVNHLRYIIHIDPIISRRAHKQFDWGIAKYFEILALTNQAIFILTLGRLYDFNILHI